MGLFGDLDASDVPENPFYVAPGSYNCVLSEASIVPKKDGSGVGLALKWVIEDEDSEYNGNNLSDWFNIYPDITEDEVTPNIRKDMGRLRQRLTQMGLTTEEMNDLTEEGNLENLIGLHAVVSCKETVDKNDPDTKYTNITKVDLDA